MSDSAVSSAGSRADYEGTETEQGDAYSIDALLPLVLLPDTARNRDTLQTLRSALGLEIDHWPSQTEAARRTGKTPRATTRNRAT